VTGLVSDVSERIWKRPWVIRDISREVQTYGGTGLDTPLIRNLSDFLPTWRQ
jgi:hypothetical protein